MASILLVYGTSEGQTEKIARAIVDTITEHGHAVTAVRAGTPEAATVDPSTFDGVIVGASIHGGMTQPAVRMWVSEHRETIETVPNGYVQVSLSSATDERHEQAEGYVDRFVAETGWEPERVETVAGALRFSEYSYLVRQFMRVITWRQLPDVSLREDTEFTDWDAVRSFSTAMVSAVEGAVTAEQTS